MISFVFVASVAIFLQPIAAAPHLQKRQVAALSGTTMLPSPEKRHCSTFDPPAGYCPQQHTMTLLPNSRQLHPDYIDLDYNTLFSNAMAEFDDFFPLIDTNCHPQIMDFLCFYYFPNCRESPVQEEPTLATPCKSLCLEVTNPEGACTAELAKFNITWGPHFDCNAGHQTVFGLEGQPGQGNRPVFPEDNDICVPVKPTIIPSPEPQRHCTEFNLQPALNTNFCHRLGYTSTLLPNARQLDPDHISLDTDSLFVNARGEFSHFVSLITSNCHPQIEDFLCFYYFPFCENPTVVGNFVKITTPCKSLCLEVTDPNGNCTAALASYGIQWGNHFDCNAGHKTVLDTPVFPEASEVGGTSKYGCVPVITGQPPSPPAPGGKDLDITEALPTMPPSATTTKAAPVCNICLQGRSK